MRIIALSLALLILAACVPPIDSDQASAIARTFASRQVKPFARGDTNLTANVTSVHFAVISSVRSGPGYIVTINMSGIVDGEEKSALLSVGVDSGGTVRSLNGQTLVPAR